MLWCSTGL